MEKIMHNTKVLRKSVFAALALLMLSLYAGCYVPSPLYGTWADNDGNKISFVSDGSFVATIYGNDSTSTVYSGSYTVIDNVLVFNADSGVTVNTEWDLRGSILYLTWTADSVTKNLTLYHTSK